MVGETAGLVLAGSIRVLEEHATLLEPGYCAHGLDKRSSITRLAIGVASRCMCSVQLFAACWYGRSGDAKYMSSPTRHCCITACLFVIVTALGWHERWKRPKQSDASLHQPYVFYVWVG